MSAPCRSEHSTKFDTGDKSTLTSGDGEPLVRRESTVDKGDGFNVKQRLYMDFRQRSRHLTSSLCTFTYYFPILAVRSPRCARTLRWHKKTNRNSTHSRVQKTSSVGARKSARRWAAIRLVSENNPNPPPEAAYFRLSERNSKKVRARAGCGRARQCGAGLGAAESDSIGFVVLGRHFIRLWSQAKTVAEYPKSEDTITAVSTTAKTHQYDLAKLRILTFRAPTLWIIRNTNPTTGTEYKSCSPKYCHGLRGLLLIKLSSFRSRAAQKAPLSLVQFIFSFIPADGDLPFTKRKSKSTRSLINNNTT